MTGTLPKRQQEVLDLLTDDGLDPAAIGEKLGISRNAVYQHITKLRQAGLLEPGRTSTRFNASTRPAPDADVSVQVEGFREQLTQRLERISEQEQELRDRLERLATEREQVNGILERLDMTELSVIA